MGISVTDETLERASRVKRLIGRPQEALLCSARKRSVSGKCFICAKAPSRNGNQPHVLVMIPHYVLDVEPEINWGRFFGTSTYMSEWCAYCV
ncbi:hypothetical protein [Lysinibacillus sp. G4S2]|uniref:hypothetical protein n=1 Tax=Lysinibacillus sp. G4S2 TaxID=3055859 RepID=UPI0025A038F4|nr:hypothetical protein [Lysinibacillus sp. G4S2]MDM5246989.1 hypothetical protein [Lysinibacillus sp. G4S2]